MWHVIIIVPYQSGQSSRPILKWPQQDSNGCYIVMNTMIIQQLKEGFTSWRKFVLADHNLLKISEVTTVKLILSSILLTNHSFSVSLTELLTTLYYSTCENISSCWVTVMWLCVCAVVLCSGYRLYNNLFSLLWLCLCSLLVLWTVWTSTWRWHSGYHSVFKNISCSKQTCPF